MLLLLWWAESVHSSAIKVAEATYNMKGQIIKEYLQKFLHSSSSVIRVAEEHMERSNRWRILAPSKPLQTPRTSPNCTPRKKVLSPQLALCH
jgi:hypothetical protein